MMDMIQKCQKCGYEFWSMMDKNYSRLFGCWSCDKKRWEQKELTTEQFELQEKMALEE